VKIGTSNLVGRFIIACPSLSVTNRPRKGHGQGHVTTLEFCTAWNIFGTTKATDFKFCARFGHEKY